MPGNPLLPILTGSPIAGSVTTDGKFRQTHTLAQVEANENGECVNVPAGATQESVFLRPAGGGVGSEEIIGNYSIVNSEFFYQPAVNQIVGISLILWHLADNGIQQGNYAGLASPLTNGVLVSIKENGVVSRDILDGQTIKTTADLGKHFATSLANAGVGTVDTQDSAFPIFQIRKSFLLLDGSQLQRFSATFRDNLTGIQSQTIKIFFWRLTV